MMKIEAMGISLIQKVIKQHISLLKIFLLWNAQSNKKIIVNFDGLEKY